MRYAVRFLIKKYLTKYFLPLYVARHKLCCLWTSLTHIPIWQRWLMEKVAFRRRVFFSNFFCKKKEQKIFVLISYNHSIRDIMRRFGVRITSCKLFLCRWLNKTLFPYGMVTDFFTSYPNVLIWKNYLYFQ